MKIRHRLKDLLHEKANGFKDYEIAQAIGIKRTTFSMMKNDPHYNTSLKDLDKLCEFFQCTPGDLLVLDEDGSSSSETSSDDVSEVSGAFKGVKS